MTSIQYSSYPVPLLSNVIPTQSHSYPISFLPNNTPARWCHTLMITSPTYWHSYCGPFLSADVPTQSHYQELPIPRVTAPPQVPSWSASSINGINHHLPPALYSLLSPQQPQLQDSQRRQTYTCHCDNGPVPSGGFVSFCERSSNAERGGVGRGTAPVPSCFICRNEIGKYFQHSLFSWNNSKDIFLDFRTTL